MVMGKMVSQDNFPPATQQSGLPPRTLTSGVLVLALAGLGLLATTTQLQWQLPAIDTVDAAPLTTASVKPGAIQKTLPLAKERMYASRLAGKATPKPAQAAPQPNASAVEVVRVKALTRSDKPSNSAVRPAQENTQLSIKQPGGGIVIMPLNFTGTIPVGSGGLPEFYKTVLKPEGQRSEYGLMQRQARKNFGYDQQDIFTGEVPDGAYVIHCQRLEKPKTVDIRAMCWRELQVLDDQWVQYRFPRTQLKDWWDIEKRVRASIG